MSDKQLGRFLAFLLICILVALAFLPAKKNSPPEDPENDTVTLDDPDTLEISDHPHEFEKPITEILYPENQ